MTGPTRRIAGRFGLDAILGALKRIDGPDPTFRRIDGRWWRSSRTPDGPASVVIEADGDGVTFRGYGPGGERELARAEAWLGCDDDPSAFTCDHPALTEVLRGRPELRFGRTGELVDALVPTVIGQRVTGKGAFRSYRALVHRFGGPAPGPVEDLWLPPDPARLAEEPYYAFHPIGVERVRATTLLEICRRRGRIEALAAEPVEVAREKLRTLRGVGPWTTDVVLVASHGDPDAVPVGDAHLPDVVAWVLAGEPRGDDARMLELLAPWAGHRARVLRLIAATGRAPPKYGPRADVPDIRTL